MCNLPATHRIHLQHAESNSWLDCNNYRSNLSRIIFLIYVQLTCNSSNPSATNWIQLPYIESNIWLDCNDYWSNPSAVTWLNYVQPTCNASKSICNSSDPTSDLCATVAATADLIWLQLIRSNIWLVCNSRCNSWSNLTATHRIQHLTRVQHYWSNCRGWRQCWRASCSSQCVSLQQII